MNNSLKYELSELKEFFNDDYTGIKSSGRYITFDEATERFPDAVFKENYTFYDVSEGGRFYVFWQLSYELSDIEFKNPQKTVGFVSYLKETTDLNKFADLKKGVHTAKNVFEIDEYTHLDLIRSSGDYSYNYLNKNKLLEIEYSIQMTTEYSLQSFVIKNIHVVDRTEVPSFYSKIDREDLP